MKSNDVRLTPGQKVSVKGKTGTVIRVQMIANMISLPDYQRALVQWDGYLTEHNVYQTEARSSYFGFEENA